MNLDRTHFSILCRARDRSIFAAERSGFDLTGRDHVIHDILTGQVSAVERVIAWNPVEHTCDDISEDIARECARLVSDHRIGDLIRDDLREFVESHCGVGTVLRAAA
jgi:hypothetical protein